MDYTNVTNPQWATADHSSINCTVIFEQFGETPFTANPNDPENHGSEIFNNCVAGKYGAIAEYVAPPQPTAEQLAASIRSQRDNLLLQSDWTQLPDVPQSTRDAWASYRQALRDVTLQAGFPQTVTWPVAP
jgi:hypothetical protein